MQAKASLTLFIVLGVTLGGSAQSEELSTLRDMLNSYITMLDGNCKRYDTFAQEARDKGEHEQALFIVQIKQTMCQCHPEKTRALLATLPREKLDRPIVAESDFLNVAKPGILEPCAGEQMRAMYHGETCAAMKLMKSDEKVDVDKFCACMRVEVLEYSDADAAVIGQEFSTYTPQLAEAKKRGTPLPVRSALLSKFVKSMQECGGAGEYDE